MDFDFTTLITDRSEADLDAIKGLLTKPLKDWMDSELQQFNDGIIRGGYTWVDLNRVTACMDYLAARFQSAGYAVPYVPIKIPRDLAGCGSMDSLPAGYTELEYIQSSGTQYIDTGFRANQDTKVILDVQVLRTHTTAGQLCSALDNANSGRSPVFVLYSTSGGKLAVGLFDLVNSQFYGNSGTGEFLAGAESPHEPPSEPPDPYVWCDTDAPAAPQMARYLANITGLREALSLPERTPMVPETMAGLTYRRANDIERILEIVDKMLSNSLALVFCAGDLYCGEV